MSDWHTLGGVEPTRLVPSRVMLHHAAQLLALAGASYLEPQADDSHTSMSWLDPLAAFAAQPIVASTTFRFALGVHELTLMLVDDSSGEVRARFQLPGHTRDEALEWMRGEARRRGLEGERLRSQLHFTIAPHPTDAGAPFEKATDGTLDELASWYGNASLVLENKRRSTGGAGPVRCWPHHFDIATLVRLPQGGKPATIGIGLSPGDDSYEEPYFYVSPYPAPTARPRSLSAGAWHTTGWWGAVLVGSEIVKQRSVAAQASLANSFIDEATDTFLLSGSRVAE